MLKKYFGLLTILLFFITPDSLSFANESIDEEETAIDVKVMSYNIHHAEGLDRVLDLERIAKVIEDSSADIIGLQEVDNHWSERSNFEDQAKWLAERLDMHYTYAANLDNEPLNPGEPRRQYGTAVLSKYPIIASKNYPLTKIGDTEQRGLLETVINVKGYHLNFYNTHLALTSAEREMQIKEIIEIASKTNGPKVIVGDMNAVPDSIEMQSLFSHYKDAFADQNEAYTFPANQPNRTIDYIFTSNEIQTANAEVISTIASDHLPITAELTLDKSVFNKGN
ncbi:endonuclease/exonuclease/phosphatase family metal-dependent hydrolase [Bacillus oleivorans]|uniref:Endonuclease/exonuclease/phosphatase family metal-dependent hydrolase n=1 Tax=Bacillus oleivorans TaxID=1448271 RepID=A0A285CT22_9BACI|nr:endonuclease/exonuclease/phosphatase family metal-dependent hydrolase [Bacillus oleivorans]